MHKCVNVTIYNCVKYISSLCLQCYFLYGKVGEIEKGGSFMKLKKMKLLTIALVSLLVLTACGSKGSDGGDGGFKDTLTLASGADAITFDIQATNTQSTTRIARQIYETLIFQGDDLKLSPGLAESWEAVDDTTYEFKLKKDVKFHNGEPFTAKDVAYTLNRASESKDIGHIVGAIDPGKIKIVDDYTIQIGTTAPYGPFLTHLAHPATGIMNEKAVTEGGEDYGIKPVGTGPYKLDNWITGSEITIKAFDDYHGEKPATPTIVFKVILEEDTRLIALENGEIDIALDISPNDVAKVEGNDDLKLYRDQNLSTAYIGFNVASKTPISDPKVRQAISHAVDVDSIIKTIYQGVGTKAVGPVNSLVFGYNDKLKPYDYDMDKAKELLAEAGYADGFTFKFYVGNNNSQRISTAEVIKESLSKLNITVEISQLEWGAFLEASANGESDMFALGWTTVTTDADYGLYPLFHSDQFGAAGNRSFYKNDRVDELLTGAKTETDPEKRKAMYFEAQEIITTDAPWIFIQSGEDVIGASVKVDGFNNNPASSYYLNSVTVKK